MSQKTIIQKSPEWRIKVVGRDKVIAKTYPNGTYIFYRDSWFGERIAEYRGSNRRALSALYDKILETFVTAGHNTVIPQVEDFIKYLRM